MLWSYEVNSMAEKEIINRILEKVTNPVIITNVNMRIVGVNASWINMCKFSHEDAFGDTPKILQGPLTNIEAAQSFTSNLLRGSGIFASLINYKKDGTVFVNHIYGWHMGDLFIAETYDETVLH